MTIKSYVSDKTFHQVIGMCDDGTIRTIFRTYFLKKARDARMRFSDWRGTVVPVE